MSSDRPVSSLPPFVLLPQRGGDIPDRNVFTAGKGPVQKTRARGCGVLSPLAGSRPSVSLQVGDPAGGTRCHRPCHTEVSHVAATCSASESIARQTPASTWPGHRGQPNGMSPALMELTEPKPGDAGGSRQRWPAIPAAGLRAHGSLGAESSAEVPGPRAASVGFGRRTVSSASAHCASCRRGCRTA